MSLELIDSPFLSLSMSFRTAFVTLLEKFLKNVSRQLTKANFNWFRGFFSEF